MQSAFSTGLGGGTKGPRMVGGRRLAVTARSGEQGGSNLDLRPETWTCQH
jgi:hypothetical protein